MPLNVGGGDSLFFKTGIDAGGIKRGATQVKGILAGLTKNITGMHIFAGLGISATIAFAIIGNEARKFATEYRAAMLEVATISDDVTKDFDKVSDSILELSRTLPHTAAGLAKAEYQIISAGITDVSESLDVLTVSAKLATAGLTDVFTTADALTSIMNAYGDSAGTAAEISDTLFTTVRLGKITMQQLAQNIGMVTGLAAQIGLEFDELSAAIAEGTKTVRPEIFFTAIRGLLTSLIRPSDDAKKVAKLLGIEWTTAALRAKGLAGFLQDLAEKTGGSDKVIGKLIPNVRGLIGLLAIAGEDGKEFAFALSEIEKKAGATDRALAKMLEDPEAQVKIMKNNIMAELEGLGSAITDLFDGVVRSINKSFERGQEIAKTHIDNPIKQLRGRLLSVNMQGEARLGGRKKTVGILKDFGISGLEINRLLDKYFDTQTKSVEKQGIAVELAEEANRILIERLNIQHEITQQKEIEAEKQKEIDKGKADQQRKNADAAEKALEFAEEQAEVEADAISAAEKAREDFKKATATVNKEREKRAEKAEKEIARAEQKIHNKKFRNLLKSFHRFTDAKLKEHLAGLREELKNEEWVAEEKKILLEKIAEIQDDLTLRSIKHIGEIGEAFNELGDFVEEYNKKIGESLSIIGKMATQTESLLRAYASGNMLATVASGVGLFTTIGRQLMKIGEPSARRKPEDARRRGKEAEFRPLDDILGFNIQEAQRQLELTKKPLEDILKLIDAMEIKGRTSIGRTRIPFSESQDFKRDMLALTEELDQLLTGTTADAIADGIADGFASGMSSAEVFALSFEKIMQDALLQSFNRQIMEGFLDEWYLSLADALETNGLSEQEIDMLSNTLREGITQSEKLFKELGLDQLFGQDENEGAEQTGIAGRIQGITETTAGVLESQLNAMRIDMKEIRISSLNLDLIEVNTLRTADNTEYLKAIDDKLKNNNNILRSMGVV